MSSFQPKIAFIGAGNMGGAILRGLIKQGYAPELLMAASPDAEQLQELSASTGVQTTTDNKRAVNWAQLVVLAVKPQILRNLCLELAPEIQKNQPLVLSLAAGITCELLQSWLGPKTDLVRSMPNTPSLIGKGIAGLYAAQPLSSQHKNWVELISNAVGTCLWVEQEIDLDAVTAISGSGPAYYFLFTEALAAAGEKLGLDAQVAMQLATATAAGAGQMLLQETDSAAVLRQKVTSPGGTTEQAVQKFVELDLHEIVAAAAQAAACRAAELAAEQQQSS